MKDERPDLEWKTMSVSIPLGKRDLWWRIAARVQIIREPHHTASFFRFW